MLGILVRRGNDFAAAEDAVQDALLEAQRFWGDARLPTIRRAGCPVAGRKLIDARRSEAARRRREDTLSPGRRTGGQADDTLLLLFLCCHPALSGSAIALTLRAVGGLTTREIAEAFLVPEATIAQRISRAKRMVSGRPFTQPGDVAVVLRVPYLIFNEGYSAQVRDDVHSAVTSQIGHPVAELRGGVRVDVAIDPQHGAVPARGDGFHVKEVHAASHARLVVPAVPVGHIVSSVRRCRWSRRPCLVAGRPGSAPGPVPARCDRSRRR